MLSFTKRISSWKNYNNLSTLSFLVLSVHLSHSVQQSNRVKDKYHIVCNSSIETEGKRWGSGRFCNSTYTFYHYFCSACTRSSHCLTFHNILLITFLPCSSCELHDPLSWKWWILVKSICVNAPGTLILSTILLFRFHLKANKCATP